MRNELIVGLGVLSEGVVSQLLTAQEVQRLAMLEMYIIHTYVYINICVPE